MRGYTSFQMYLLQIEYWLPLYNFQLLHTGYSFKSIKNQPDTISRFMEKGTSIFRSVFLESQDECCSKIFINRDINKLTDA